MGIETLGVLLIVGLVVLIYVIRYVVSFTLHRGFDAAENAYKKSKNKQQEAQAQQAYGQQGQMAQPMQAGQGMQPGQQARPAQPVQGMQPGQPAPQQSTNAGALQEYLDVAAAYGIIVRPLGELHGKKVDIPVAQPVQSGQAMQRAQSAQPVQAAQSVQAPQAAQPVQQPVQKAQPIQAEDRYRQPAQQEDRYRQPAQEDRYRQPAQQEDRYRQPAQQMQEEEDPSQKNLKKILLIAIAIVAIILVFLCGLIGSRLIDRFTHNRFVNIEEAVINSDDADDLVDPVQTEEVTSQDSQDETADSEASKDTGSLGSDDASEYLPDKSGKTFIKISEIPDMQMLLHLLNQVRFSYGNTTYSNLPEQQHVNAIQKIVTNPNCVCFADYNIAQPSEASTDPRGYLTSKYAGYTCMKYPETSVIWVAKNILHLSDESIERWTKEEGLFYLENQYYYSFMGGIGDDFHYPEIVGAMKKDNMYYIYYNYVGDTTMFGYSGDYDYANVVKAAYEKVEDYYYWTIYREDPIGEGAITCDYVYGDDWNKYADVSGVYDWNSVTHPFNDTNKAKEQEVQVETTPSSGNSGSGENAPFYGLWIGAWSDKSSAEQQANEARAYGYDACVLLSSDWENLNPKPYYVVTAGRYSSESAAEKELPFVQKNIIDQAYVKYSGNHK